MLRWFRIIALSVALLPAAALAAPSTQVQGLRREIAALQLDHALNLSAQQAQALLPELQEARAKVAALKSQWSASEPARVAALTQAVADLKANGTISEPTAQALQAARSSALGTVRQDLVAFWSQAKQVLTADQLRSLKAARLAIGQPAGNASDGRPAGMGGRHHPARRFLVMRTLLSDEFLSLAQARAG